MISLYPPYISSFFWFPSLRIHIFWSSSRIHFQHLVQPLGVSSTKVSISALPLTFTSSWNPKPTMPSMGIVRKAEPYSWRPAERPAAASRNVENPLPISQVPCKKWHFFFCWLVDIPWYSHSYLGSDSSRRNRTAHDETRWSLISHVLTGVWGNLHPIACIIKGKLITTPTKRQDTKRLKD